MVSDWSTIFELDAEHSGKRWTAGREHVSYAKGASDIRHVFLLADEANQKPKFLIALALGIPCVSITWLLDSILEVCHFLAQTCQFTEDMPGLFTAVGSIPVTSRPLRFV